jgi:signal transduction histidine kinase
VISDDGQRSRIRHSRHDERGLANLASPRVSPAIVSLRFYVILNLLLNAGDAMNGVDDRPRQVLIRTEREEADRVRLTVQDVGVGFDTRSVDQLFEAFYSTKTDGMGIGLSVSRSIIENHDGHLWAASNDGSGATFAFSLPRRAEIVANVHAKKVASRETIASA